ncbi:PA14 domain-containing protein [Allobaculum mucilyticum]|uniref:PA14 domain-containing protein n=1 Tax=Allobaculum mucilyticum TaxID=2834459 RepID=UPI001E633471|nr:PA14 domain-containing protein [Allobaculum mucilyticum]UNT95874.1 hypothetical protein KWG62_11370 [Allobaculum mucilyticum]
MKRIRSAFLIALPALTVLGVTGVSLFRYFAAELIMENGGTMNPDDMDSSETPVILDGDHTYADNEILLQVISGTWSSEDGHYVIELDSDCRIRLSLDGEQLLDDHIQFVYLQPGIVQSTEFFLDSCVLQRKERWITCGGKHFLFP